jgi:hypothetical protein
MDTIAGDPGKEAGQMSFIRRLAGRGQRSRPAPGPAQDPWHGMGPPWAPAPIPLEGVDYGSHGDELELFLTSLGMMNEAEAARVHQQGLASGAQASSRWAELEAHLIVGAGQHGLGAARVAAQRRAEAAAAASAGRAGNRWVVTDYCAGVWAEVLVLRDHLPGKVRRVAFEPWRDVLQEPDWL